MNRLLAEAVALATAVGTWSLATRAASRRRVLLGSPPVIAFGLLVAVTAVLPAFDPAHFVLVGGLAVAAVSDARTGLIFTPVSLALIAGTLSAAIMERHAGSALAGATAVGAALFTLRLATGGRGLGLGDVRLGCALGAGLGTGAAFVAVGCAFVLGGVYGAALLLLRRAHRKTKIRFAPFLAAGTLIALLPEIWP